MGRAIAWPFFVFAAGYKCTTQKRTSRSGGPSLDTVSKLLGSGGPADGLTREYTVTIAHLNAPVGQKFHKDALNLNTATKPNCAKHVISPQILTRTICLKCAIPGSFSSLAVNVILNSGDEKQNCDAPARLSPQKSQIHQRIYSQSRRIGINGTSAGGMG